MDSLASAFGAATPLPTLGSAAFPTPLANPVLNAAAAAAAGKHIEGKMLLYIVATLYFFILFLNQTFLVDVM